MVEKKLVFALHFHQPSGNFQEIFEKAATKSYFPLLNFLSTNPNAKMAIHISGPLYDWLWANRPAFFTTLKSLIASSQVELLTGALYEPILSLISREDAIDQIKEFSTRIEQDFKIKPRGMWLAERVWEPQMAEILFQAGVEYLFLDQQHLKGSGYQYLPLVNLENLISQSFEGLKSFVISDYLRDAIPYLPANQLADHLMMSKSPLQVFADDAEKFGLWPGSYELCYKPSLGMKQAGYFEDLMENLEICDVKFCLPSEIIDKSEFLPGVYLNSSSYSQMNRWSSVNQEDSGYFRNFLMKYSESSLINSFVNWISENLRNQGLNELPEEERNKIITELFKAQCNCGYWHGVFGGVYLPHLRSSLYGFALAALEQAEKFEFEFPSSIRLSGSVRAVMMSSSQIQTLINPVDGGTVGILGCRKHHYNLASTFQRIVEPDIAATSASGYADLYPRKLFRDHFLSSLADLNCQPMIEQGSFYNSNYKLTSFDKTRAELCCSGFVILDQIVVPVKIDKYYRLDKDVLCLDYVLDFKCTKMSNFNKIVGLPGEFYFASEICLTYLTDQSADRYVQVDRDRYSPGKTTAIESVSEFSFCDDWQGCKFNLGSSEPFYLRFQPEYSFSRNFENYEKIYQFTSFFLAWKINLPQENLVKISLEIQII